MRRNKNKRTVAATTEKQTLLDAQSPTSVESKEIDEGDSRQPHASIVWL